MLIQMKYMRYLMLQIVMCHIYCISFSQPLNFTKEIRLDNRSTILRNVVLEGDSLIVTGEIGRDSLQLTGFFIFKMDTAGNIGNIKYYRDPDLTDHALLDGINPITINSNGTLALSGHFLALDDAFFMVLNKSLDTIIYKSYINEYRSLVINCLAQYLNEYYLIGKAQTQNYDLDVFIMKVDSVGNRIWEKTYGLSNKDEFGVAFILDDGGLTIRVSKAHDPTPTIKNDSRYWAQFINIDTSGILQWMWEEEVTGDEGYGGAFVKYGTDYIYTTNYLGDEYSAGILQAAQLVRRDSAFNLVWRKVYGEPVSFSNYFGDMAMSRDSNLLLAGQILDDSGDFNWARVMKICPDGEVLCETRDTGYVLANGESLNRMEGIIESLTGSIYAVGYTNRSLFLFDGLILKVSPDGCIDTLCTTTSIEDNLRLLEQKIDAYPNPMQDELNIVLDESLPPDVSVSIYNTMGHLVFSDDIDGHKKTISVADWPVGLYVVQSVSKGSVVASIKVVKSSK